MSERLLRADERLLVGHYYKAWMPSPRIPQGQGFSDYLAGRDLELVESHALNASAVVVVVRALGEKTYRQAASNFVGALAAATNIGLNPEAVVLYEVDGPPGFVDRAVAPIAAAGARVEAGAARIGQEAAATTRSIRQVAEDFGDTIRNLSTAAKWIAIGVPLAGAALALGYLVWTGGKALKK